MKQHLHILLLLLLTSGTHSAFAQQSGDPDSTFAADGIVITDIQGNSSDHGTCMALQPDGRIVMAGNSLPFSGGSYEVALSRTMPDGSPDLSFGTGGSTTTAIGTMDDGAHAVAIQPDGRIVVAGTSFENGSGYLFLIARYNADGTLDNSFSGDGWRTDDIGTGEDRFLTIALQADGKIVAAGYANNGSGTDIALARYNSDGSLDDTFSGDGIVVMPVGPGNDAAGGVAVQPDGRIVIAGYSGDGTDDHFTLVRFTTDGTPDPSFGTGGVVTSSYSTGIDQAFAIALQPDGHILAGGVSANGLQFNPSIMRYEADGDLDLSFGGDGMVVSTFSPFGTARSLVLMPDGRIVAGGTSGSTFMVLVFNPDGTTDNSFSSDGALTTAVNSNNYGNSVAVQPDGKILLAGIANSPNTGNDFVLIRYLTDLNIGVLELSAVARAPLIYPNPIGHVATLQYTLADRERITIELLDVEGRVVQTFLSGVTQAAGEHQLNLEFCDAITPGNYVLNIAAADGRRVSVQVGKK